MKTSYSGYVAFLDILGFSEMIKTRPIDEVLHKMSWGLKLSDLSGRLGKGTPNTLVDELFHEPLVPLEFFTFSDTFVLSTKDTSPKSLFQIIASTAMLSKFLITAGLPIRGAIAKGELAKVSDTDHLIGRGIINAAELEKQQEWFGIALSPEIINNEFLDIAREPLLQALVVEYNVPMKSSYTGEPVLWAINWRYNLSVHAGIKSLFPKPRSNSDKKLKNTIDFSKFLRSTNQHEGILFDSKGLEITVPWKQGLWIGPYPPDDNRSIKRDE